MMCHMSYHICMVEHFYKVNQNYSNEMPQTITRLLLIEIPDQDTQGHEDYCRSRYPRPCRLLLIEIHVFAYNAWHCDKLKSIVRINCDELPHCEKI